MLIVYVSFHVHPKILMEVREMWIQRMAEKQKETQNQKVPLEGRTLLERHTEFYGNSLKIGKKYMNYETS